MLGKSKRSTRGAVVERARSLDVMSLVMIKSKYPFVDTDEAGGTADREEA